MKRKYFPFCFYVLVSVLCLGKPSPAYPAGNLGGGGVVPAVDDISKTDSITPLKIGDKIPDELWEMTFPVVSAGSDDVQHLKLGDYRDKLIILDFWATWCAPCISSLHKLDTLQQEFADDLLVFPTSYETQGKVSKFFTDKGWSLPTAFEETHLKKYFPHKIVPHQVWLRDGKVLAITSHTYTNRENIGNAINRKSLKLDEKRENMKFDYELPLLIAGNGGDGKELLYHSMITEYIPGMVNAVKTAPYIRVINQSVLRLYAVAFEKEDIDFGIRDRMIVEVDEDLADRIEFPDLFRSEDPGLISVKEEWLKRNTYCYELILPGSSRQQRYERMLTDLNEFFGLSLGIWARIEERMIMVSVLKRVGETKTGIPPHLASLDTDDIYKLNDKDVSNLLASLVRMNKRLGMPLIAEPGIGNLTLRLSLSKLSDLKALRDELNFYGLDIVQEKRMMKVMVISSSNLKP